MGLGFAAFGAELPELEARCHERLTYARPTVLAATEDPQGTRVLNLFARDWTMHRLRRLSRSSDAVLVPHAAMFW